MQTMSKRHGVFGVFGLVLSCAIFASSIAWSQTPPTAAAVAPSAAPRPPDPDAAAIAKAMKLIDEVYGGDIAKAKTSDAKLALAETLFIRGMQSSDNPADRIALFRRARDLAVDGGGPAMAAKAIRAASTGSVLDNRRDLIDALTKIAAKAFTTKIATEVMSAASAEEGAALLDEDWESAKKLSDVALAAARKSKDVNLAKQAFESSQKLSADKELWDAAQSTERVLQTNPDDVAANLAKGRYLCFVRNDWSSGLPCLAKSNDPVLRDLATKSKAIAADTMAYVAMGDAWWDAAEKAKGRDKEFLQEGAARWYLQVYNVLVGLTKSRVTNRLTEMGVSPPTIAASAPVTSTPSTANSTITSAPNTSDAPKSVVYLDDLTETHWRGVRNLGKHGLRHDDNKFTWLDNTPDHALFTHPFADGTCVVTYDLNGRYDKFEATVGLASRPANGIVTFRVVVDGRQLWQSPPMQDKDVGKEMSVSVRGAKMLTLEVTCAGRHQLAHAAWINARLSPMPGR